ncbi:MAG: apolipoprotein N-acyltransferase [Planctomycetes bacterium]|nr:apolipoprotein N-acyltransferase [Planctomycetota bacterium]
MSLASETSRALEPQPLPAMYAKPSAVPWATPERRLVFCALATSGLLYLCYFPVAWGFLAWVALVPLIGLVRSAARLRWVYGSAYLCGLAFYLPAIQWMRVADPRMVFTWIALSFWCAAYLTLAIFLARKLDRRTPLPLALTLPVAWTAVEFIRANFLGGFPWYLLGYSQHRFDTLIQVADVTGVYGLSFLLVAVNALVFEWLYRLGWVVRWLGGEVVGPPEGGAAFLHSTTHPPNHPTTQPRRPVLAFQSAVALLVFAGCLGYGSWRLGQADFRPGPRIALIQSNMPQQIRNQRANGDSEEAKEARRVMEKDAMALSELAAPPKRSVKRLPLLVVWPETSYPVDCWNQVVTQRPREHWPKGLRRDIERAEGWAREVAADHRTNVLLGLNVTETRPEEDTMRRYNSALLIGPDARIKGRYDKIHRVPFGEFVPFREMLPFMNRFAPYDFEYSIAAGESQACLPLGAYRFGVVICYEDTDPSLAREYVNPARGDKADFLINISNDGWFDGTSEHEEHLAICRFRAIESRRAVARSVNMGISAVIDGNGRVLTPEVVGREDGAFLWDLDNSPASAELPVGRWGEFKKVPGVLFATIPLDDRGSLYARWGDWLPLSCWALIGATLLVLFVRRRLSTPAP